MSNNENLAKAAKGLEPNMVDKFGNKWYIDPVGTRHAQDTDKHGISLGVAATVWVVESIDGLFKICLVIDNKTVFEAQHVQQVGHEIDRLRALKLAGRRF